MTIDDNGVWIRKAGHTSLDWHPATELDDPDQHNPRETPHLPFPFSACHLAAFMTGGLGEFFQDCFGELGDGPDEEVLDTMPAEALKAKDAIRKAYQAYREALAEVGELDASLEREVCAFGSAEEAAGREARASLGFAGMAQSVAWKNAAQATRQARDRADSARAAWRKKIVQHLLNQRQAMQAEQRESGQDSQASNTAISEAGLSTGKIAEVFDFVDGLKERLGDVNNHKWLMTARLTKGNRPAPATWHPLILADLLMRKGLANEDQMAKAFLTPQLREWRGKWQEARRERNAFGTL